MAETIENKALKLLEDFNLRSMLDTDEKRTRYMLATKHGYSPDFALVFAQQNH